MKTLVLRKTKTGKGVFANRIFRKGEKIIEFKKNITNKNTPNSLKLFFIFFYSIPVFFVFFQGQI